MPQRTWDHATHKMYDGWSVRVQDTKWKLALPDELRRFVLSAAIHRHFRRTKRGIPRETIELTHSLCVADRFREFTYS